MINKYQTFLSRQELAANTVRSYVWTVKHFLEKYNEVTRANLLIYKGELIERYKPQTVNLRLQALNKYLEFTRQEKLKMRFVKVQQKNFLENVISDADYKFLKTRLKKDGHTSWLFVVWFLTATGARVSELLQIKAEHVRQGYLDIYSKGGKLRRLYIPKNLRTEASLWLKERNIESGYIFLNRFGERITARGIAQQLKIFANKYGINPAVVYPHSFRHRFAKNFLSASMTLLFLPTSWATRASRPRASTSAARPPNSRPLSIKPSIGNGCASSQPPRPCSQIPRDCKDAPNPTMKQYFLMPRDIIAPFR